MTHTQTKKRNITALVIPIISFEDRELKRPAQSYVTLNDDSLEYRENCEVRVIRDDKLLGETEEDRVIDYYLKIRKAHMMSLELDYLDKEDVYLLSIFAAGGQVKLYYEEKEKAQEHLQIIDKWVFG